MNQQQEVKVKSSPEGILVPSELSKTLSEQSESDWLISNLGENRFLVQTVLDSSKQPSDLRSGVMWLGTDNFADLLKGCVDRGWSGAFYIDTGHGNKRLFFKEGELSFASSGVIDDRLGEVVYRDGIITLDQMVSAAVKVDRNTKFGQVLLQNQILSGVDLWKALQLQVQEILRSIFLVDKIFVEIFPGRGLSFTEVVFLEGTKQLIDECLAYGKMFQVFSRQLTDESQIFVDDEAVGTSLKSGTFFHDFMLLARESENLKSLIESSKLKAISTKAALLNAVNMGLCVIKNTEDQSVEVETSLSAFSKNLRDKIDIFEIVLKRAKDEFIISSISFPIETLKHFAESMNPIGFYSLILDSEGFISVSSKRNLFSQCETDAHRARFFEKRVEALTQFLIQLSGDILKNENSQNIRQAYKNLTQ